MFTRRCGDNPASGVNYDHATPARADIYSQEKHMFARLTDLLAADMALLRSYVVLLIVIVATINSWLLQSLLCRAGSVWS
jgi:hypothetical protein